MVKRIATVRAEATREEVRVFAEELTKKHLSEKIEREFDQQLFRANLALEICRQSLAKIGNRELQISTRRIDKENIEVGIALLAADQKAR